MANGLVEYLRALKEYDWKPDDKEIWGRAMWTDLSEWAKIKCKDM